MNASHLQNIPAGVSLSGAAHGHPVLLVSLHEVAAVPVPQVSNDLVPKAQACQLTPVQRHRDLPVPTVQLRLQTVDVWKVKRGWVGWLGFQRQWEESMFPALWKNRRARHEVG